MLSIQARKYRRLSWARCPFSHYDGTFWHMISKNPWSLTNYQFSNALEMHNREIFKLHWKSLIIKCQYCYAHISTKKAPFFMIFTTRAPRVIIDYLKIFHKHPCTNASQARVDTYHYKICFGSSFSSYELENQIS